jgi:hypothetical protein
VQGRMCGNGRDLTTPRYFLYFQFFILDYTIQIIIMTKM